MLALRAEALDTLARADRIVFRQNADNSLSATAHGNPVAVRQKRDGVDEYYEGYAQRIEYDGAKELVELFDRALLKRGQDTQPVIARRLLAAGSEMAHAPEFDYAIVNEEFETAVQQLAAIVTATRLRYGSQAARHHELFAQLGIVG